jgi:DNA recombination protein RmuC
MRAEDGTSIVIPDVVIRLPGERQIVVDSKFTLPDYRTFAEADADDTRAAALKRHLTAIRNHINGLSEKKYQTLYELQTLDFVVMFIPLEPAFMIAVTNDAELFSHAWSKNVLLVSPSTLLFVVRTIAHLWRQDALSRNAREISKKGADLYDKIVGVTVDLEKVGVALEGARRSHDEACKKFFTGQGNAMRQAEMLKELGVKPSKALSPKWSSTLEDPPAALPEA